MSDMHDEQLRLTRRRALSAAGALGAGAVVSQLSGPGKLLERLGLDSDAQAAVASCTLTPDKTEGPYFVDERLLRSDIRSDPSTGTVQQGVPLTLKMVVVRSDGDCAPVTGAAVDVWHANASGLYSDVQNMGAGGNETGKQYLRGYQLTDGEGAVSFTTIYPGWYSGRSIHIHFSVRLFDGSSTTYSFTSQMFFDPAVTAQVVKTSNYSSHGSPDTSNSTDNVYGSDGDQLLVTLSGDTTNGYTGTFVVGVDGLPETTTTTTTTTSTTPSTTTTTDTMATTATTATTTTSAAAAAAATGSSSSGSSSSGSSSSGSTGSSSSGSSTSGSTTTANTVQASLTRARWKRAADDHRLLRLTLSIEEAVTVTARLTRSGRTLAKKTASASKSGVASLKLPATRAAGKATLTVVFTDEQGKSKSTSRQVTVPRKSL